MPRLEYISITDDTFIAGLLAEFKKYASVPDDSLDTMYSRILRNAALRVQEYADRALLQTRIRVTLPIPAESGIVRLYMGGGNISQCKDDRGDDIRYDPLPGGRLQLFRRGGIATIEYTTAPSESDRLLLSQAVIRYATADNDGAETAELNRILSESVL